MNHLRGAVLLTLSTLLLTGCGGGGGSSASSGALSVLPATGMQAGSISVRIGSPAEARQANRLAFDTASSYR